MVAEFELAELEVVLDCEVEVDSVELDLPELSVSDLSALSALKPAPIA
jgi:hypothetical protein